MRALVVVLVLAAPAAAEPDDGCELPRSELREPPPVRTWIANDETFGVLTTPDRHWVAWGAGLAVRRRLGDHVELDLAGHALRLQMSGDDPSHGFALRASATIGYGFEVSRAGGIRWRLAPQLGVATAALVGDGTDHGEHELFAGVRASFHKTFESEISGSGVARGIGGHLGIQLSRSAAGLGGWLSLGYDWGL